MTSTDHPHVLRFYLTHLSSPIMRSNNSLSIKTKWWMDRYLLGKRFPVFYSPPSNVIHIRGKYFWKKIQWNCFPNYNFIQFQFPLRLVNGCFFFIFRFISPCYFSLHYSSDYCYCCCWWWCYWSILHEFMLSCGKTNIIMYKLKRASVYNMHIHNSFIALRPWFVFLNAGKYCEKIILKRRCWVTGSKRKKNI